MTNNNNGVFPEANNYVKQWIFRFERAEDIEEMLNHESIKPLIAKVGKYY